MTIRDEVPPTIGTPTGSLFAGGWLRGTKDASVTGQDSTGIDRLELRRNGIADVSDARACDFTKPAPCASPGQDVASNWGPIDTTKWGDGTHQVTLGVRDAGGNETVATVTVKTDNTAPIAPVSAGPADGVLWSALSSRPVEWSVPAFQASPIVAANVSLCASPTSCATVTPDGVSRASVVFPQPGLYSGSVWLQDEAGNGTSANAAPLRVGYDPNPAPAPGLGTPVFEDPNTFVVPVDVGNDPGPAPVDALEGAVCTAGGATCEPFFQTATDRVRVSVPGPGTWQLRVHAVDAADNRGADAQATLSLGGGPTPTATPTAGPTRTPTPTPTSTPPAGRKQAPQLKLTAARLKRTRIKVRGVISPRATGRVTVALKVQRRGRSATIMRRTRIRRGRFTQKLRIPEQFAGALRGRLRLTYAGDRNFRSRTLTRTVQR